MNLVTKTFRIPSDDLSSLLKIQLLLLYHVLKLFVYDTIANMLDKLLYISSLINRNTLFFAKLEKFVLEIIKRLTKYTFVFIEPMG